MRGESAAMPRELPSDVEVDQLVAAARELGVALAREQATRLLRLLDELSRWNRAYNLTAITERTAMVRAHLLDSLSAAAEVAGSRIADAGTGAGFPGLPLAVLYPERAFTLIDSVAKKIRFVTHAARVLELTNIVALHARVEALAPDFPFDTVIARAFAPLPVLLRNVQGLTGPATRVIALMGRAPSDERLAQLPPPWRVDSVRAVNIPGLAAERHIVRLLRAPAEGS
jgi:16S rRNA (guanine527-N7)-methyltransferase